MPEWMFSDEFQSKFKELTRGFAYEVLQELKGEIIKTVAERADIDDLSPGISVALLIIDMHLDKYDPPPEE